MDTETSYKLVLIRHGQSVCNLERRFTGWTDVDLTNRGRREAQAAGRLFRAQGYSFDLAFTSLLRRAIKTLWIILDEMELFWIPVHKSWRLNERHYGALQGLSRSEMVDRHGERQVELWRRSYHVLPPRIDIDDPRHPSFDRRYSEIPCEEMPPGESLEDVFHRLIPYWQSRIAPEVKSGKNVLIVGHGNSLRALMKHLAGYSDEEIVKLTIPTGIPLICELEDDLGLLDSYYLMSNGNKRPLLL